MSELRLKMLRDHVTLNGISTDFMMKMLSEDAKVVAGGCFGMMRPGHGEMRFGMKEHRPTERMQAALDELEAAGGLSRKSMDDGAVVYTPLVNFWDFFLWAGKQTDREDIRFRIVEPIHVDVGGAR